MANADTPFGLKPIRGPFRTNSYTLATSNTAIGVGDIVVMTTAGTVDIAAASCVQTLGVALSQAEANSGAEILVSDHPGTIYVAQMDDATTGTGDVLTGVGGNFNIVATPSSGGQSRMEIDENTLATTATLPIKVLKLYAAPNNAFGTHVKVECILNNSILGGGTGSDGLAS